MEIATLEGGSYKIALSFKIAVNVILFFFFKTLTLSNYMFAIPVTILKYKIKPVESTCSLKNVNISKNNLITQWKSIDSTALIETSC